MLRQKVQSPFIPALAPAYVVVAGISLLATNIICNKESRPRRHGLDQDEAVRLGTKWALKGWRLRIVTERATFAGLDSVLAP